MYNISISKKKITEGHLTEEQALDEIRDLCLQLQELRERMPSRGTAVTMVSTLLEQCRVSSKTQPITIVGVKKVDSHSNGSMETFQQKKTAHSATDNIHQKTSVASKMCSKNGVEDNGASNVCEQMRSHLNQVNGNATIATCLSHICTTADVYDVRGVGNEPPPYSSDCHNEQLRMLQSKNQQSLENMENASGNEQQPSTSNNTKPNLDFSNLKLRCMCSEVNKFHSCMGDDEPAVTEINDSETANTMNARCIQQYHRCETPDCVKECYIIQRCCFCRQSIYNSDATSVGPATASATNKSSNVHRHDEIAVCDSVQIAQHRHSSCSSEMCNLKLTLSTGNSDKICRCENEHCHNNQSYCDDGAIKNTCHCMRMCDFDLDRIDDERRVKLPVPTVIFTSDVSGSITASGAGPNASTAEQNRNKKCDKSSIAATTAGHTFVEQNDDDSNAETAPTTSDTENTAGASTTIAEDTSIAINNLTNEKRTKTAEKLVLDLNDRSKYTKEVSV